MGVSRLLDFANTGAQWKIDVPTINHSFVRFALPITWDFAESNVLWGGAGSYPDQTTRHVVEVKAENRKTLYVDPSGSAYGRYVGIAVEA